MSSDENFLYEDDRRRHKIEYTKKRSSENTESLFAKKCKSALFLTAQKYVELLKYSLFKETYREIYKNFPEDLKEVHKQLQDQLEHELKKNALKIFIEYDISSLLSCHNSLIEITNNIPSHELEKKKPNIYPHSSKDSGFHNVHMIQNKPKNQRIYLADRQEQIQTLGKLTPSGGIKRLGQIRALGKTNSVKKQKTKTAVERIGSGQAFEMPKPNVYFSKQFLKMKPCQTVPKQSSEKILSKHAVEQLGSKLSVERLESKQSAESFKSELAVKRKQRLVSKPSVAILGSKHTDSKKAAVSKLYVGKLDFTGKEAASKQAMESLESKLARLEVSADKDSLKKSVESKLVAESAGSKEDVEFFRSKLAVDEEKSELAVQRVRKKPFFKVLGSKKAVVKSEGPTQGEKIQKTILGSSRKLTPFKHTSCIKKNRCNKIYWRSPTSPKRTKLQLQKQKLQSVLSDLCSHNDETENAWFSNHEHILILGNSIQVLNQKFNEQLDILYETRIARRN